MATEKRLIDANKLIEALPIVTEDKQITLYGAVADFMVMISAMPTEDAVEVVRCKDCFANDCCSVQIDLNMGGEGYCPKGRKETRC